MRGKIAPNVYLWSGDPTNADLKALNPPEGALVIDMTTPAVYLKQSARGDNSSFASLQVLKTLIGYASLAEDFDLGETADSWLTIPIAAISNSVFTTDGSGNITLTNGVGEYEINIGMLVNNPDATATQYSVALWRANSIVTRLEQIVLADTAALGQFGIFGSSRFTAADAGPFKLKVFSTKNNSDAAVIEAASMQCSLSFFP